jgi:MtN3 and saliva related transmembrane protein
MSLISILATIFGTLSSFALIPQIHKIFKRKSAKDISHSTYAFLSLASLIWVIYGFEIQSYPIIIANFFGLASMLIILLGWFLYGR